VLVEFRLLEYELGKFIDIGDVTITCGGVDYIVDFAEWSQGVPVATMVPDFPAVGNVTTDDTVNGATGTFAVPTEAQVESGVGFGAGGTEFTGELDVPTAEEIAAAMWSDVTSPDRTTTA
jgi:hypothetical protein